MPSPPPHPLTPWVDALGPERVAALAGITVGGLRNIRCGFRRMSFRVARAVVVGLAQLTGGERIAEPPSIGELLAWERSPIEVDAGAAPSSATLADDRSPVGGE